MLWPLLVWVVYLPAVEKNWKAEKEQYDQAQKIMEDLLKLDPDRLDFADSKTTSAEFDYATAVDKVASRCRISSTSYSINSRPIRISSGGQKTQNCQVILKDVDITKFAEFLSTIQLRWENLECERLTLTHNKGLPDSWKVEVGFKYYH